MTNNLMDLVWVLFPAASFASIVKIVLLSFEFLFLVFSFIMVRQISLMNTSFKTPPGISFKLLGYAQFFVALGIFLLTLTLPS